MPTVTIDAADLETLLFFTSAIGDIEKAVTQRSRNPMVLSSRGSVAEVHDRLAAAWRRASRPIPDAPSQADLDLLQEIVPAAECVDGVRDIEIGYWDRLGNLLRLGQTLQLVEYGPALKGTQIQWPAPSEPGFVPDTQEARVTYGVRLTARGQRALDR